MKADEHYAEETPLGKALIGYLEGVSENLCHAFSEPYLAGETFPIPEPAA